MTAQEIIAAWAQDPDGTRECMIQQAYKEIVDELQYWKQKGHGPEDAGEMDMDGINYSEYCRLLSWPDFGDGGIFEQCIEVAGVLAFKTVHGVIPRWADNATIRQAFLFNIAD